PPGPPPPGRPPCPRTPSPRPSGRLCKPQKYDGNSKHRDRPAVKRRKDAADAQLEEHRRRYVWLAGRGAPGVGWAPRRVHSSPGRLPAATNGCSIDEVERRYELEQLQRSMAAMPPGQL